MKSILRYLHGLVNRALHKSSLLFRSAADPDLRPVFIIGSPRTGSTALYQLVTHCLQVGYFDNLAAALHGSTYLGVSLSRMIYDGRPHGSFKSVLGSTRGDGLHAPSECGSFWYRWLPRQEHFASSASLEESALAHVRVETERAQRASRCSAFVFKNLNAGQRLQLIAEIFPEARFIWCRRKFDDTVASILKARRKLGIGSGELWSVRPADWPELLSLAEYEMVEQQVDRLEKQIVEDLALFPQAHVIELDYDTWRRDIVQTVTMLEDFIDVPIRSQLMHEEIQNLPRFFEPGKA